MEQEKGKGLGYLLERTTRLVKLNYSQAFKAAGYNVTPEQWVILDSLYVNDKQTQNELAELSFKDAPTISRIIDLLEKKGFVTRETVSTDKRSRKIFMTTQGRDLVENMQPLVSDLRSKSWEGLTDQDFSDFVRIINRVFQNYGK